MAQMHKRVKISIISLRLWEIKELSDSNIILQDCYNGHLAHFQYTSLSILRNKFFHSTMLFIHSFIPAISIAPLQVLYYSEALPSTAVTARILHRSFTPKRTGNC